MKDQKVLVSGASIAGLTTAWWLQHIGYKVTVVELSAAPRTNGAALDLTPPAVAIVKRMGLYEQFKVHHLGVDRIEYKNAQDETEGIINISDGPVEPTDQLEIEREKFVAVLMDALNKKVEFMFNDRIAQLTEDDDKINVTFLSGKQLDCAFVVGCDGAHSGTRKLWFGPEENYAHFLGAYFSISIIPELLVPQRTMQTFSVPYKSVMLNAYNGKTDVIFIYLSEEVPYDYRNVDQQRQIITEKFKNDGWRTNELLQIVNREPAFYFDKFCQIKMPSWSKSRVVLVGDAAYCPSPAAGQGGALAMQGAAALADALVEYKGDYLRAFKIYESQLRPHIEEVQATAELNVNTHFVLRTEEEIRQRNAEARSF